MRKQGRVDTPGEARSGVFARVLVVVVVVSFARVLVVVVVVSFAAGGSTVAVLSESSSSAEELVLRPCDPPKGRVAIEVG
jgi:hypothetical protein